MRACVRVSSVTEIFNPSIFCWVFPTVQSFLTMLMFRWFGLRAGLQTVSLISESAFMSVPCFELCSVLGSGSTMLCTLFFLLRLLSYLKFSVILWVWSSVCSSMKTVIFGLDYTESQRFFTVVVLGACDQGAAFRSLCLSMFFSFFGGYCKWHCCPDLF